MYIQSMELVRLGVTSVEAYDRLKSLLKSCLVEMQPSAKITDGLGLEDELAENGDVNNHLCRRGLLSLQIREGRVTVLMGITI